MITHSQSTGEGQQDGHRLGCLYSLQFQSIIRKKMGKGIIKRVLPSTVMTNNWKGVLRLDQNKTYLLSLLSREIICLLIEDGKELYTTCETVVLCSLSDSDLTSLGICSQQEADTRMLLPVADAVYNGITKVAMRTVDTDVVVLTVACFSNINPDELWIALSSVSSFPYILVHRLAAAMNPRQCDILPIFHTLSWCDAVRYGNCSHRLQMALKNSYVCQVMSVNIQCPCCSDLLCRCMSELV